MTKQIDRANRKHAPMWRGLMVMFPDALEEASRASKAGNLQHYDSEEIKWDRTKSSDDPDAMMRHLADYARGEVYDEDNAMHLGKAIWRLLAFAQKEIEKMQNRE